MSSAGDESLGLLLFCREFLADEKFGLLGVADQDFGIKGLGLGEPSLTVSEMSNAVRGDDGDLIVPFDEELDDADMVDASGLQDDLAVLSGATLYFWAIKSRVRLSRCFALADNKLSGKYLLEKGGFGAGAAV